MLELLAPAGDVSAFDTAIKSGADAVYLGLDSFNARMRAQNFNADNIGEVVARAHFYGVKVYVTINTILQNEEFSNLISLVKVAVDAKVDAFLVQDLGVAKLLHDAFDGIVLHASTQMGVHNLYGAKVAESMGIKRVVLSREARLEDIRQIRDNTSLEIEYFVQGALCIAFSGNCYLSSVEQGASGNRGLCKQLCRLPYIAKSGGKTDKGYMLSARDLCLARSVKQLADAGVCSLKIEGRLRRDGYVAEAVQTYRKIIDEVEKGQRIGFGEDDENRLKVAFSRGDFLDRAYLDEGVPKVVEKRFNNHTGIRIGVVREVKPFKNDLSEVVVFSSRKLNKGDGIKFFDKDKESASLGIGEAREKGKNLYSVVTAAKVKPGWTVNLISDAEREKQLSEAVRFVPISLKVKALKEKPLQITAYHKSGDKSAAVTCESEDVLQAANNAPTDANEIAKQCRKVADSGFCVDGVEVDTDGVFIAKSVLNALRREVFDKMKAEIVAVNSPAEVKIDDARIRSALDCIENARHIDGEEIKVLSADDLAKSAILKKEDKILLRPPVWRAEAIEKTLEFFGVEQKDAMLELPIIANGKDLQIIENVLEKLPAIKTLVSENIYGLHFVQKGYGVIAGQGHNIANAYAVHAVKDLGACGYVPSLEYPDFCADGEGIARYSVGKNIPLMTFAHCPYKTMFDCDCSKCAYKGDMTLQREKHVYKVTRTTLSRCYFALYPEN